MRTLLPRIAALLVLAAVSAGAFWWYSHRPTVEGPLTLYGTVDLRQASLSFNGSERIAEVLAEEGQTVLQGQVLARLSQSRLLPQLAQSKATVTAQQAALDRLKNGSRPEEIAQAQANLEAAKADAANASAHYQRFKSLLPIAAVSKQDVDEARAQADVAVAKVAVQQNALSLAQIGPRAEDIAQAEAQLQASEAAMALLQQQVDDTELKAPFEAVIRSRLMEPGEMATPSSPVFSVARLGTKWVRAYVPEPRLSEVREGLPARITIDSDPARPLDGWIGFISPLAEFTPKTVQTEDLRTSLVYEVRVFVTDPDNRLRLGMPATVRLLPAASRP
ncbi:HlyD family efflux transporter periplasmic adaptor subunit [Insolitispirillum peregrinum]|uniref:HlyD family secretion protein n=1 Tax=Insolitispirillum peregrinum TaxID=80876 RepID=A0A1N7L9Z2_9PROT|nr:HlyD family efflux transporter periplasmic adaptor subunit [Insolitispirillum peregrinum]SIS70685.1 HlyD family secretion protein [Insolitispirillum peregrinum]